MDYAAFFDTDARGENRTRPRGLGVGFLNLCVLLLAMIALAVPKSGLAAVSPQRLQQLSRGVNADNIVNNTRYADYTSEDLLRLREMGFTYVRIPIDPSFILTGLPVTGQSALSDAARVATGLARLDLAMASFTNAGLAVTLVLQPQAPFMALPDAQTEQFILQGVGLISQRYAQTYNPDQLTFEALNEPRYDTATWNAFAPSVVAAIRQYAPAHTIIVPPAASDIPENFAYLTPIADSNIVYTMHMYEPYELALQGTRLVGRMPYYRFPKRVGQRNPTEWTVQRLIQHLHIGIDWAAANHVPLIMNEFGATHVANRVSRANWIRVVRQTADNNHVGWAWWSFDGRLFGLRPRGRGWDQDLLRLLK